MPTSEVWPRWRGIVLAALTAMGCTSATRPLVQPQGATAITPAEQARLEIDHPRSSAAGVTFMSGMIPHHAQAIVIAQWAPSHGASPAVRTLCERIAVSQADEIRFMQQWLTDRHQPVPTPGVRDDTMPGMERPMRMPGMLSAEQMRELDGASGTRFDRLLLTDMIMHHRGAIDMVRRLTASGQVDDDEIYHVRDQCGRGSVGGDRPDGAYTGGTSRHVRCSEPPSLMIRPYPNVTGSDARVHPRGAGLAPTSTPPDRLLSPFCSSPFSRPRLRHHDVLDFIPRPSSASGRDATSAAAVPARRDSVAGGCGLCVLVRFAPR